MKKFMCEIISSDGKKSSKRLVTLLAFLLIAIGFIANLFWDQTIDPVIFDAVKWIVIGGLGATASEQFSHKKVVLSEKETPSDKEAPMPSDEEILKGK